MLFVTYWELNEAMPVEERLEIARKLTEGGHFPPDDVEVLRWDATADDWGILVLEADSAQAVQNALTLWRASGAGFFQTTKTAPAVPVRDAVDNTADVLEGLA